MKKKMEIIILMKNINMKIQQLKEIINLMILKEDMVSEGIRYKK